MRRCHRHATTQPVLESEKKLQWLTIELSTVATKIITHAEVGTTARDCGCRSLKLQRRGGDDQIGDGGKIRIGGGGAFEIGIAQGRRDWAADRPPSLGKLPSLFCSWIMLFVALFLVCLYFQSTTDPLAPSQHPL